MHLEKFTRTSQVKVGDILLIRDFKKTKAFKVEEVVRPGILDEEEIIIKLKSNKYFITSMVLMGTSWAKEVQIVRE